MLEFEPYSLDALKRALPYIKNSISLCSELSAGSLFMWQEGTDLAFCFWNDTLVIRQNVGDQPAFTWPMGNDVGGMVDELIAYAKANHIALRFYEIDDSTLDVIRRDERLKKMMCEYEDRWSDYIYSFDETVTFSGSKYKGQRNHINKFKRLYGEPVVRFVTENDNDAVKKMLAEYRLEHGDADKFESAELKMAEKLFDVCRQLELYAVCLTVSGEIAAISIGEVIGDRLLIHVEKALKRYEGIYPTMYQGFVRLIGEKSGKKLRLINREDDSGDEGLRISKLQYHPVGRVNKYLVHVNSPALNIEKMPVISFGDVYLTEFRESDKQIYLKLNTDIDNNRFWGYDYREDEDIFGKIDQNTFYNSAMVDMRSGDSLNFAVRTSPSGDMIGEAILWNFTADGFAEVGCRILPEYQGKGYGKAAFSALADFAEQTLKVKPEARCYIQNTVSYRMITASGFNERAKDKDFYYFSRAPR